MTNRTASRYAGLYTLPQIERSTGIMANLNQALSVFILITEGSGVRAD
jgi:hypothetical protein